MFLLEGMLSVAVLVCWLRQVSFRFQPWCTEPIYGWPLLWNDEPGDSLLCYILFRTQGCSNATLERDKHLYYNKS